MSLTLRQIASSTDSYDNRYYKGNGAEIANNLANGGKGIHNPKYHDSWHLISSGIFDIDKSTMAERYQIMEDNGYVDQLIGLKAEILVKIYTKTIESLEKDRDIDFNDIKRDIKNHTNFIALNYMFPELSLKVLDSDDNIIDNPKLSHNTAANELLQSYIPKIVQCKQRVGNQNWQTAIENYEASMLIGFDSFISNKEIKFHIEKATELFNKLKTENPDIFDSNGKIDEEKFLDLPIKNLAIDNIPRTLLEKSCNDIAGDKSFRRETKITELPVNANYKGIL